MSRNKRNSPICGICNYIIPRKEIKLNGGIKEICNKCKDSNKMIIKCSNCGSLSCRDYGHCVRITGKPKMQITHFYFSRKDEHIYLVTNTGLVFTTNKETVDKLICDYPIKDLTAPVFICIEEHTQYIAFPLEDLDKRMLFTNGTKDTIRKYVKYAEDSIKMSAVV